MLNFINYHDLIDNYIHCLTTVLSHNYIVLFITNCSVLYLYYNMNLVPDLKYIKRQYIFICVYALFQSASDIYHEYHYILWYNYFMFMMTVELRPFCVWQWHQVPFQYNLIKARPSVSGRVNDEIIITFSTIRPSQGDSHFREYILKCIFLNENV